ncbi:hypothetical protein RND81_12G030100 [Saponaria officinalis]|uniref:J domain-containing protein n=1 Tax=Saponaria officinalis TaxID=3572 RepID=A0AAW1H2K7_SAPOF
MQCDTVLTARAAVLTPRATISFTTTPTRITFPTRPTKPLFQTLKTRATVNDPFTKPVSELSFYELLGIPETGTIPEIKQAYKQLARIYHPDVSPPGRVKEYTERFIRVQEAYETLSDPRRRAVYDRDLSRGLHLAFSARRNFHPSSHEYQETEDKSNWRSRWQSQLSELKKRSFDKDERGNMSWGARMRRQRDESS